MASAQGQSSNLDLFDAYFRRADLDRDGQISGNEAVAFFQGSGLHKHGLIFQGVGADMGTCRPEADWFPWLGRVYTTVSEEKQQGQSADTQSIRIGETSCKSIEYRGG